MMKIPKRDVVPSGLYVQNCRAGFTLIETLIYSVIVMMIVSFTTLAAYQIINYQDRVRAQLELQENGKFLTQKIQWVLQNNSAVNSPSGGASGASLSVSKLSFAGNPLVVDLNGGVIRLKTGTANPVDITNRYVSASNLTFNHYVLSGLSAIRARVTLQNSVGSTSVDTTIFVKQ